MDQLEYGTSRPRRPWLLPAAVVLGVLLLAVGVWADSVWRSSASATMDAAASQVAAAVDSGQQRVAAMRAYVQPATSRPDLDPGVRADMETLVESARIDAVDDVVEARGHLAAVIIAPWHDDLALRRAELLTDVDTAIGQLRADSTLAQGGI